MKEGEVEYAERAALNQLDQWNDVAEMVPKFCGYYYELQAVICDAVHIGIQMALFQKIKYDTDGNVKRSEMDSNSKNLKEEGD